MALSIPLLRKRRFNTTLRLGFIVLCLVLISSVFIYIHVISEGPILYYFGNHAQRLGIEFKVDAFSSFFTMFIVILAMIIYIYSSGDQRIW
jgi:formate hydrogenlyase subunit 3/multisubunit Na+/H+ antiporter MnhD subunit